LKGLVLIYISEQRIKRLNEEMRNQKQDMFRQSQNQNAHLNALQNALAQAEDRIDSSNEEIAKLCQARDLAEKDRRAIKEKYDSLRNEKDVLLDEAEQKVLQLQKELVRAEVGNINISKPFKKS
jgi:predicted nuclease with TOPRIM domain